MNRLINDVKRPFSRAWDVTAYTENNSLKHVNIADTHLTCSQALTAVEWMLWALWVLLLSLAHKISASFVANGRRKRVFTKNKMLERTFFIKCWVGFRRVRTVKNCSVAALGTNFNILFTSSLKLGEFMEM